MQAVPQCQGNWPVRSRPGKAQNGRPTSREKTVTETERLKLKNDKPEKAITRTGVREVEETGTLEVQLGESYDATIQLSTCYNYETIANPVVCLIYDI